MKLIQFVDCKFPTDIVFDEKNQNYIAINGKSDIIYIFDKCFNQLYEYRLNGNKQDQRYNPRRICLQPSTNRVIIVELFGHRIQIFDDMCHGKIENLYIVGGFNNKSCSFWYPTSTFCNRRGDMIVSDAGNYRVQILNEKGCFIRQLGITGNHGSAKDQFKWPNDVLVNNINNQIIVADYDNKRLSIWSGDGSQHIKNILLNDHPACLTFNHHNEIIVGFTKYVLTFDTNMILPINEKYLGNKWRGEESCFVSGISVNDKNELLVCNSGYNQIQVYEMNN